MREIKFRGKSKKNNVWVYGYYVKMSGNNYYISLDIHPIPNAYELVWVYPESIGQYLGLHNKNGKDIYCGDIVKINAGYSGDNYYQTCISEIKYDEEETRFYPHNYANKYGLVMQDFWLYDAEILGNTFENKDLLNA